MKENILCVSESPKPLWETIIAAFAFTAAFGIIVASLLYKFFNLSNFKAVGAMTEGVIYLVGIGVGFSRYKKIYVDLKNSKFRATTEVGPIKIGKWVTIKNYEYVSIFLQLLADGSYIFEVNLWYNKNKHFKLYEKNNFEDALAVAYDLSEELNIDLLDATIANDYKWIDKEALKQKAV
ncbi:hypothetical protein [Lacinutrix cladophorae]